MKTALRQRAWELGFDACRVTTAAPPDTAPRFEAWLAAGRHGEMAYLARNTALRLDPRLLLPGARSIVTLAVSYFVNPAAPHEPASHPGPGTAGPLAGDRLSPLDALATGEEGSRNNTPSGAPSPHGLIARYARYRDYHRAMAQPLAELAAFINALDAPATRSVACADAGPVLERDLAQRAGLGFVGKHTNLVSRQFGNWFFLAEILTTLELEPDPAQPNRCGTCTRCLQSCPTRALVAPFQLDARRCLSYLTIELKGPIPTDLRPAIGNRIFGCDDCLSACPWNRFARAGRLMGQHVRPELAEPRLLDLLAFDEAMFKRRFADTPLARAKRRGLLRNVCVALGNVGTCDALPALERATHDPEPLVAEHARWAVTRLALRVES